MTAAIEKNKEPLLTPVQFLKGVGPYIAQKFENLEIRNVQDLLFHFPSRYLDRRQITPLGLLEPGKEKTIIAEVVGIGTRKLGPRKKICEMVVSDNTGLALVVWFQFNETYLKKKYKAGMKLVISGDCQKYGAQKQFAHPDIEEWEEEGGGPSSPLVPVYPATDGLFQKTLRKVIAQALPFLPHLDETPLTVRESGEEKISIKEALLSIHQPPATSDIIQLNDQSTAWHKRVIYDELFYLQLGLAIRKRGYKKEIGLPIQTSSLLVKKAVSLLPFTLTGAQQKVLSEVSHDLALAEPMNRLVQGDVGCGKTMVAFLSALTAIESGYQAALMAPTEILAGQHYINLKKYCDQLNVEIAILTGSTSVAERKVIDENLLSGKIKLLIGTHALIEDNVVFKKLALVVIDEQHRFGVKQRALLKRKGDNYVPHLLVMTATPIPRTLAMSLYGDLDVSVIDTLPTGRKKIVTRVFWEKQRKDLYAGVMSELKKGHQAYFIYPLIEESEKMADLKDAVKMEKELAKHFAPFKTGLLHGKMKNDEKEAIMKAFKSKKLDVLVSTTVVEVGVDVPNATVMVIEHAERFGLSQLHQLRGRVGRGADQSYCFLMAGYAFSDESRFRLRVMEQTTDGFVLAEEDLNLRGPGDFMGTRQSGLPPFKFANIARDRALLSAAQKRAEEIVSADPELKDPKYQMMKKILSERWDHKLELANVS